MLDPGLDLASGVTLIPEGISSIDGTNGTITARAVIRQRLQPSNRWKVAEPARPRARAASPAPPPPGGVVVDPGKDLVVRSFLPGAAVAGARLAQPLPEVPLDLELR